ncbi:MAG: LLM class flavin-dependent oxidoreductase [Chloroflexi bacterium]|nr:LLM class flavin-dependent oxidoreductase [Chloroflexota bacterium]
MLGIGLTENIPIREQVEVIRRAEELGYQSAWSNQGRSRDAFLVCQAWAAAAPTLVTGISVVPVAQQTPLTAAAMAATMAELTDGKFVLGLGISGRYDRQGIRVKSPLRLARDYVGAVRGLLRGETVSVESEIFRIDKDALAMTPLPPAAPVMIAALGPKMQELGGEIADGLLLNWNTVENVREVRERVAAGAARAGRDPKDCQIWGYVRVSVDDDPEQARAAMAIQAARYAGSRNYRAQFERFGFKHVTDRLQDQPQGERFIGEDETMLRAISVYGTSDQVQAELPARLAPYDHAIVRIVPARPGMDSIMAIVEACAPR